MARELVWLLLRGNDPLKAYCVGDGRHILGRSDRCSLRIRDVNISREHAEIRRRDTELALRDLGSRNGTYLNNSAVNGWCCLKPGDTIRLGRIIIDVGRGDDPQRAFRLVDQETPFIGAVNRLSTAQREVANYLLQGLTEEQVARLLGVKRSTVHTHVLRIYEKLDIGSRTELVRLLLDGRMGEAHA